MHRQFGAWGLTANIDFDFEMNHSLKKRYLLLATAYFSPHAAWVMFIQHQQKWSQNGKNPTKQCFLFSLPSATELVRWLCWLVLNLQQLSISIVTGLRFRRQRSLFFF